MHGLALRSAAAAAVAFVFFGGAPLGPLALKSSALSGEFNLMYMVKM